jgi:uncharacterized membrane protein YeiH
MAVPSHEFTVPFYFDYGATFLWGVSGALVAARNGYDISGVAAIALVSATGGGLIRDGIFIQNGPPALVRTPVYLILVAAAALLVLAFGRRLDKPMRSWRIVQVVDALGLGAYAVVGMQIAIDTGLSSPGVILVGVVNAVGGGILRDVFTRRMPQVFEPGTLTATAALASCLVFVALEKWFGLSPHVAAWPTIFVAFLVRMLSVVYGFKTQRLPGFEAHPRATLRD